MQYLNTIQNTNSPVRMQKRFSIHRQRSYIDHISSEDKQPTTLISYSRVYMKESFPKHKLFLSKNAQNLLNTPQTPVFTLDKSNSLYKKCTVRLIPNIKNKFTRYLILNR